MHVAGRCLGRIIAVFTKPWLSPYDSLGDNDLNYSDIINTTYRVTRHLHRDFCKLRTIDSSTFLCVLPPINILTGRNYENFKRLCDGHVRLFTFNFSTLLKRILDNVKGLTMFVTENGRIGKTYQSDPSGIVVGDIVVGLFHTEIPFVLRPASETAVRIQNVVHVVRQDWGQIESETKEYMII